MLHKLVFLVLLAGLHGLALAQAQDDCHLRIHITVLDEHAQEPLRHAVVQLADKKKQALSDANGKLSWEGLCPGHLDLIVSHLGCATRRHTIELQRDTSITLYLEHHSEVLQEITIEEDRHRPISFARSLKGQELENQYGEDMADALDKIPGVDRVQFGNNISKPLIQGQFGNRLVVAQNGLGFEGQTWSIDHAPMVSTFGQNEIQVIQGAAPILYGPQAQGGVVDLKTRLPTQDPHLQGKGFLSYRQNGHAIKGGLELEQALSQSPTFSYRLNGSYAGSGDQRAPNYTLSNTGYEEYQLKAEAAYRHKAGYTLIQAQSIQRENGLFLGSHIGNLTDLRAALARSEPFFVQSPERSIGLPRQWNRHSTLGLEDKRSLRAGWTWTNTYNLQYNELKEYDQRRGLEEEIPTVNLRKLSHNLRSELVKDSLGYFDQVRLGSYYRYSNNWFEYTGTAPLLPFNQEYAPALYALVQKTWGNWQVQLGSRLNYIDYKVRQALDDDRVQRSRHTFWAMGQNLRVSRKWNTGFSWDQQLSYTERPPALNELYIDGVHHGAAAIERGDPGMQTEQLLKFQEGLSWQNDAGTYLKWNAFGALAQNYIYAAPEGTELTIRGAFPVFAYQQQDVLLAGTDFRIIQEWGSHWQLIGQASYTHGSNRSLNTPLLYMPPLRTQMAVQYEQAKVTSNSLGSWSAKLKGSYTARQWRHPKDQDFAPAPAGFFLLSAVVNTEWTLFNRPWRLQLSGSNLLNTEYRHYLDRFRYFAAQPGWQAYIKLFFTI